MKKPWMSLMIDGFVKKYTNAHMLLSNMAFIRKSQWLSLSESHHCKYTVSQCLQWKVDKIEKKKKQSTHTFDSTIDAKLVMLMCKFQYLFTHGRNHMFWNICYKLSILSILLWCQYLTLSEQHPQSLKEVDDYK